MIRRPDRPDFERFLTTIRGGCADRVPVAEALVDNQVAVRAQVRERVAALAPAGGYLVGSSNSIPDWVPVENYVAMLQAAFDYGRYPIPVA